MAIKFVTPPAAREKKVVGTKASGTVEIEVFGGLTTAEQQTIQEILQNQETAYVKAATLSAEIAASEVIKKEGKPDRSLSMTEAYKVITNAVFSQPQKSEAAEEIALKYAKKIDSVGKAFVIAGLRRKYATVTAIIKHRLDPEHTYEETLKLHGSLVDAIHEAAMEEEVSEDGKQSPPTEEDLGKQQAEE
jgi:hypothetical protein